MSLGIVLLIVLMLVLVSTIPLLNAAPHWGYAQSGHLGPMVLVVVVLLLTGLL